jgi:hypothetical protein
VPAKGSITVSGTMTNSQTLPTVPANGSVVTPVPFVWRPPDPSSATQSQKLPDGRVEGHFCLLSRLASADDPILFPSGGESSVIDDNNISMKNEHVYSAKSGGKHRYRFFVRSSDSAGTSRDVQLIADVAGLPARTVIAIQIPALKINHKFIVEHAKAAAVRTGQIEAIAVEQPARTRRPFRSSTYPKPRATTRSLWSSDPLFSSRARKLSRPSLYSSPREHPREAIRSRLDKKPRPSYQEASRSSRASLRFPWERRTRFRKPVANKSAPIAKTGSVAKFGNWILVG